MAFKEITYEEDGPVGTITLNRPDDGNMFTETMCHEIRDCIEGIRREARTCVVVLTGAGDLLLSQYLDTEESKELKESFAERRQPDATKFGH